VERTQIKGKRRGVFLFEGRGEGSLGGQTS